MKKLFFAIISTFAINASADGCFYDFETDSCEPVLCLNPISYPNWQYLHFTIYGEEVGKLCNTLSKTYLDVLEAGRITDLQFSEKDKQISDKNKLIKKLKKACGSKCKNIR